MSNPDASGSDTGSVRVAGRILLGLAAALLAIIALVATGPDGGAAEPVPPMVVSAIPVEREPGYASRREFVGTVRAGSTTDLAFDLAGRVENLRFDDGDRVKAGAPVARLDTDRLEAERASLAAALEAAEARRSQAGNADRRLRRAHSTDPASVGALELEDSADELRAARAEVERIGQQLRRVDLDLEKSRLVAPFDGVVARRMVDAGGVVTAGMPVIRLLADDRREARIGLAPSAADALKIGRSYQLDAGGIRLQARLRRLLPVEDERLRTVEAVFELADDGWALRDGRLVALGVDIEHETAGFWLPLEALTASVRGLWAVYVLRPAEHGGMIVVRHEVEVLHERDSRVFVRSSLPDGARVVTTGVQRLTPGQAARAKRER